MYQNIPGYSLVSTTLLNTIHHEIDVPAQLHGSDTPNIDYNHSPNDVEWFDMLGLVVGVPKLV